VPPNFMPILENPGDIHLPNRNGNDDLSDVQRKFFVKVSILHDVAIWFRSCPGIDKETRKKIWSPLEWKKNVASIAMKDDGTPVELLSERPEKAWIPVDKEAKSWSTDTTYSTEETHPSFLFARRYKIPMWGRHSFTVSHELRLLDFIMYYQSEIKFDALDYAVVMWSQAAWWRQFYDHTMNLPYHTFHETLDGQCEYINQRQNYDQFQYSLCYTPAVGLCNKCWGDRSANGAYNADILKQIYVWEKMTQNCD